MSRRRLFACCSAALIPSFIFFFRIYGFSKEAVTVFVCAAVLALIAIGLFVRSNGVLIDDITTKPSAKNVETFLKLLFGSKGSEK